MSRKLLTAIAVLIALVVAGGAAAADIPMKDGLVVARQLAATINRTAGYSESSCRYQQPLVVCHGLTRWPKKSDTYVPFRLTMHKTAPRRGYAMLCMSVLPNWAPCRRYPVAFTT